MRKCACTYRAGVDGCGAEARRVATIGRASCNDGSAARDDGYAARDDRSAVPDNGSTAHNDGYAAHGDRSIVPNNGSAVRDDRYESLKKIRRRRVRNTQRQVQGRATTGRGWVRTAEIGRRQLRSQDDGLRDGRRRVRPHAEALRLQYIRGAD